MEISRSGTTPTQSSVIIHTRLWCGRGTSRDTTFVMSRRYATSIQSNLDIVNFTEKRMLKSSSMDLSIFFTCSPIDNLVITYSNLDERLCHRVDVTTESLASSNLLLLTTLLLEWTPQQYTLFECQVDCSNCVLAF